MFLKVDSYVINDEFALKIGKKRLNGWAASRYFSNFLFDLGKIDLPRITHEKFQFNLITDYEMVALNPPPP